jgi:hypothetical protein
LRAGTVTDEATLSAVCLSDAGTNGIPDPHGRIARKADKLATDVDAKCVGLATPIAQLFPGACADAATGGELTDCLAR